MSISEHDMQILLGTDKLPQQIQRILDQQPGCTMSSESLESIFSFVSKGRLKSAIFSMRTRGIISFDGKQLTLICKDKMPLSEMVWKVVKMLRTFTQADILKILPDIKSDVVYHYLRSWCVQGLLEKEKIQGLNHYRLCSDLPLPRSKAYTSDKELIKQEVLNLFTNAYMVLSIRDITDKLSRYHPNDIKLAVHDLLKDAALKIVGFHQKGGITYRKYR